jgi:NitT/TauT family transport system permease protein
VRHRFVNRQPGRQARLLIGLLPFVLLLIGYQVASSARLAENAADKLLPSFGTMGEAIQAMAFTEDVRTGDYLLWVDTGSSLMRLGTGVAAAATIGLFLGVMIGLFPYVSATLSPFVAVLSMIPPLALLPILFIAFGTEELAKIVLIVFGIAPFMVRDIAMRTAELPSELLIKAQTLGASSWQILVRVALPHAMPRLIGALRLALGPAWLFLIAAEAIASTDGLGYRIFLVRRFLAMDVILVYVAWITLLAYTMDAVLAGAGRRLFPWAERT